MKATTSFKRTYTKRREASEKTMPNTTIPAETIKQFLAAAHGMLSHAGFTRNGGKQSAPRTAKTNMAYIYNHPKVKGDIWLHSDLRWAYLIPEAQQFGPARLVTKCESRRLSTLSDTLKMTVAAMQGAQSMIRDNRKAHPD